VFLGAAAGSTAGAGTQNFVFFQLFGSNGSAGMDSDLSRMLAMHEDPADLENPVSKNLFFEYGVLQMQYTSRAANTTPVVLDIYEYKVRRNIASYLNPAALVTSMLAEEDILQDPATAGEIAISLGQIGVTPYQLPNLCKNLQFGRKTTILVDPGKTATYTLARKRKRWLTGQKVIDSVSFAQDGWTEGVLVVFRGAPSSATTGAAATIDYMYNRKYCWRAMDPDAKNEYLFEVY